MKATKPGKGCLKGRGQGEGKGGERETRKGKRAKRRRETRRKGQGTRKEKRTGKNKTGKGGQASLLTPPAGSWVCPCTSHSGYDGHSLPTSPKHSRLAARWLDVCVCVCVCV